MPKEELVRTIKPIPYFDHKKTPAVNLTVTPTKAVITNRPVLKFYELVTNRKYDVFKLTFDSAIPIENTEKIVTGYYYKPQKKAKNLPLILVFPVLAGDHTVSEWQAKILANYGFAVIRFEKKQGFLNFDTHPDFHQKVIHQTIIDSRRFLDCIEKYMPEINPKKIGVTGISLGAISASLLMEADDRIQFGAFFLLGGNLPKIISTSNEINVEKYKRHLTKNINALDLEKFLQPIYKPVDPLTYADRMQADRLLMLSAKRDRAIIPEVTRQMWEAYGRPEWIQVPFVGHYSAFFYFFYGNKKMAKFFHKKFNTTK